MSKKKLTPLLFKLAAKVSVFFYSPCISSHLGLIYIFLTGGELDLHAVLVKIIISSTLNTLHIITMQNELYNFSLIITLLNIKIKILALNWTRHFYFNMIEIRLHCMNVSFIGKLQGYGN